MFIGIYQLFSILRWRGAFQFLALLAAKSIVPFASMLPLMLVLPLIRVVMQPGRGLGAKAKYLPDSIVEIVNDLLAMPPQDVLIILIIAATVAQIMQGFITVAITYVTSIFLTRKRLHLSSFLFKNFLIFDYGRLSKAADALNSITVGTNSINAMISSLLSLGQSILLFSVATAILILLFPIPSLSGILFLVTLTLILNLLLFPYIKKITGEAEEADLRQSQSLVEKFKAIKELKVLGREQHLSSEFRAVTEKSESQQRILGFINSSMQTVMGSLHYISLLVAFFVAFWLDYPPDRIGKFLIVYILLVMKVSTALSAMGTAVAQLKINSVRINSSYSLIKKLNSLEESVFSKNKMIFKKNIQLENVSFYYPKTGGSIKVDESTKTLTPNEQEKLILKDINLTIHKGNFVAFVGKNGSGKTTLIDLLAGYHIPTSGKISIDDTAISFENAKSWHLNIGYVVQQPCIIRGTILENIAIGLRPEDIDIKRLQEIIEVTKLDEVLAGLPNGLETELESSSFALSGGQAQRINIARALYRQNEVLILDEATKAIDPVTEKEIIQNIMQKWSDKLIIMITHRMETLKFADTVYVISEGRVAGHGSFEDLAKNNEFFRQLVGE